MKLQRKFRRERKKRINKKRNKKSFLDNIGYQVHGSLAKPIGK